MFNLPDDIIDLIFEKKEEAEKIDKENKIFKNNKKRCLKELKRIIFHAKYDFYEDCQQYNLEFIDWHDYVNNSKKNIILNIIDDYYDDKDFEYNYIKINYNQCLELITKK